VQRLVHSRALQWRPPAWALALLGFFAAYVVVTWPLVDQFWHATYGGPGDGWALIWQTRFRLEHGISYFSPTYSRDIAWPVGANLPSSLLLSNAAVELPYFALLVVGIGDVAAYNMITLAAAMTSSLAMYALLRRVECRPTVAFWGGLVYLLAPWHLEKLGIHPTLASMAALPLLLLGIIEWVARPGLKSGAFVVGATVLATYTHSYYGLAAGAVLLASLPIVLVASRTRLAMPGLAARTTVLAGVLLLVPLPLALALHLQSSRVSPLLARPLYLTQYAAHPYVWLLPSTDNPIFGEISRSYIASRGLALNEGELALYLGWLTLALALAGIALGWRRRGQRYVIALATTMAVIGALLSLPGSYHLPLLGTVKMPVAYVNDAVQFVSTPARFFALTLTGVVTLAGTGLELSVRRLSRRRWVVAAVGTACLLSCAELPFFRKSRVIDTSGPPVVQLIKAEIPTGQPVAQYPSMASFYAPVADQLFYQLQHGHPLVNGATATSPEDAARVAVEDESSPQTPRILALFGVRWATYEPSTAAEKARLIGTPIEDAYAYRPPRGFKVVRRLADGTMLMRVVAKPAPAFVSIATGFSREGRWLMHTTGTMLACATASGDYTLRFKAGAFARARFFHIGNGGLIFLNPAAGEERRTGEERVRTRVHLRAGWQLLRVRLIGSKPIRPSDVIPGEPDSRPLAVSIGPITVTGPHGPARRCSRSPRPDKIITVG
jgi:hypothetical protein